MNFEHYYCLQAVNLAIEFLDEVMLLETVFKMGDIHDFDSSLTMKGTLYMDSQALENLDILDVSYLNKFSETHSLFGYMDYTASPFGKRELRKWLTAPLMNIDDILDRQEAIDDLLKIPENVNKFQKKLKELPDIERMINRIYNLSDKKRM